MSIFSQTQVSILRSLADGELTLADISRQSNLSKPNLSVQLAQLEKEGWITRRQQSAKRIFYKLIPRDYFESQLKDQQGSLVSSIFDQSKPKMKKPHLVSGFNLDLTTTQRNYLGANFIFIEYP